jgi:hypothetical protein
MRVVRDEGHATARGVVADVVVVVVRSGAVPLEAEHDASTATPGNGETEGRDLDFVLISAVAHRKRAVVLVSSREVGKSRVTLGRADPAPGADATRSAYPSL